MPRKKIKKAKTRAYLVDLLDKAGVDDRYFADSIKAGLESENAAERTNARDLAAQLRGFKDVDKKVGEEIEHLPIGNISIANLDRLANRCAYCKHRKFEPIKGGNHEQGTPGNEATQGIPGKPGGTMPTIPIVTPIEDHVQETPKIAVAQEVAGIPGETIPPILADTPPIADPIEEHEQNPQEKAD